VLPIKVSRVARCKLGASQFLARAGDTRVTAPRRGSSFAHLHHWYGVAPLFRPYSNYILHLVVDVVSGASRHGALAGHRRCSWAAPPSLYFTVGKGDQDRRSPCVRLRLGHSLPVRRGLLIPIRVVEIRFWMPFQSIEFGPTDLDPAAVI
jgi:hypothetical protein